TTDDFYALMGRIGFDMTHHYLFWSEFEPRQGRYTKVLDHRLEASRRQHVQSGLVFGVVPHLDPEVYRGITAAGTETHAMSLTPRDAVTPLWLTGCSTNITAFGKLGPLRRPRGDPSQWRIPLGPDPDVYQRTLAALIGRYGSGLEFFEPLCEPYLFLVPEGQIRYFYRPAYPVIKKYAPDLPVLLNQTSDFETDGTGGTETFFRMGGNRYIDGISDHPYGAHSLRMNGLPHRLRISRFLDEQATHDRSYLMAQTEVYTLGSGGATPGWDLVQTALLDWTTGARWSVGAQVEGMFFWDSSERSGWWRRGAHVPGPGAAALNAMRVMLGGAHCTGRIDLDDYVLIGCFAREDEHILALTAANIPLLDAFLDADLDGIDMTCYDQWGEPVVHADKGGLALSRRTQYIVTPGRKLEARLRRGRVVWSQSLNGTTDTDAGDKTLVKQDMDALAQYAATGVPPRRRVSGILKLWDVIGPVAADTPWPMATAYDTRGREVIRLDPRRTPYILFGDAPAPACVYYARARLSCAAATETTFRVSATGPLSVRINGRDIVSYNDTDSLLREHRFTAEMEQGLNVVTVRLDGGVIPAALVLGELVAYPAVDTQGYIRVWSMLGPFPNPHDAMRSFRGNTHRFPPEKHLPCAPPTDIAYTGRGQVPILWHRHQSSTPEIDHPYDIAVSYAMTGVAVTGAMEAVASVGSDDGFVLWVNGIEKGRKDVNRSHRFDTEQYPVFLHRGTNTILMKIDDTLGGGGFSLRLLDRNGTPLIADVVPPLP
ncbi:MAG: hypothetical protein JXB13_04520, partial [Phycisphaerae bacterium]|nr:hypothetical protein [Phycisphaerae bacterium]